MTSVDESSSDQPSLRRLQRSILADDVYEAVKGVIMDHVIEPAARAHDALHIHLHQFRLHYVSPLGGPTIEEHATIAEAILSGSSDEAARAALRHLDNAQQRLTESPVLGPAPTARSDRSSSPKESL